MLILAPPPFVYSFSWTILVTTFDSTSNQGCLYNYELLLGGKIIIGKYMPFLHQWLLSSIYKHCNHGVPNIHTYSCYTQIGDCLHCHLLFTHILNSITLTLKVVLDSWSSSRTNRQSSEESLEHSFEQEARDQEGKK